MQAGLGRAARRARRAACRWGSPAPPPGPRRPTGRPARTSSAGRPRGRCSPPAGRPPSRRRRPPRRRRRAPGCPAHRPGRRPGGRGRTACGGASNGRATTRSRQRRGPERDRTGGSLRGGRRGRRRHGAEDEDQQERPAAVPHASDRRRGAARRRPPSAAICGRAATLGKTTARARVCCPVRPVPTGRLRASSSRRFRRGSRHLGPSGQPPGVWRRWTPGRRTTRCPRQPRSAATGRAHRERRPWQSSA